MRRNPPWTSEELILALDLYLRCGAIGPTDNQTAELSALLNSLPIHDDRPDRDRFRNRNGVKLKLANFRALDPNYTGLGMAHGSKLDVRIWDYYSSRPDELKNAASNIREWAEHGHELVPDDTEAEAIEGALLVRVHRTLERNRNLVSRKKQAVLMSTGELACEVCGFVFETTYGELGHGFIECHHVVPLSRSGPRRTTLSDLAVLCSNCHRMAHRGNPWPTLMELTTLIAQGLSNHAHD